MRVPLIICLMMFLAGGVVQAATVDLTDGRSVQGNIMSQDSKSLQINVDGVNMTYYADEIKDVDGQPFGSAPAPAATEAAPAAEQSAAPAETTPPETAAPAESTGSGIDPEKRELILKFIDVFGTRQALIENFNAMIEQIRKEKPAEADDIRQRVKVDEIIERLLPVYDRNFSSDDLKAFIAFYSSPEGQKLITTIPELMKESVQESIKYMQEKFPEVQQGR